MRIPHLLDQEPVLDGSQVAHIAIRPYRVAYLVPQSRSIIAQVIAACSMQWSGFEHLIIPLDTDESIASLWRTILRIGDPDFIVDAAGVADGLSKNLENEGWPIYRWKAEESNLYVNGALIYAGINAQNRIHGRTSFPREYLLVDPKIDPSHELFLPAIARFGLLLEDQADEARNLHGWAESVRVQQMIRCVGVDLAEQVDAILGAEVSIPAEQLGNGISNQLTLPQLGRCCIRSQPASYVVSPIDIDRLSYDEGFLTTIVVTGPPDSVQDLALFWNIRASRVYADPFPLWIPIEQLDSDIGSEVVRQTLNIAKFRSSLVPVPTKRLCILSASLSTESLAKRLAVRYPNAEIRAERLENFVSVFPIRSVLAEDREARFVNGSAQIPLPRPPILDHFGPGDRVSFEIQFDAGRIPGRQDLFHYRPIGRNLGQMDITRRGAFAAFSHATNWPSLVPLSVPSGWQVLTRYFESKGYKIRLSDKARISMGIASLFSGRDDRKLLNSSLVYDLLRDLSRVRGVSEGGFSRQYCSDRKVMPFSEIKNHFGKALKQQTTEMIVTELIRKRIVFRGAELRCPYCDLKRWYPLDRISDIWQCDGCQQSSNVPLKAAATTWQYRINELCAAGFDQGAMTPINVMMISDWESALVQKSLLGYYPGVVIEAVDGHERNLRAAEIDVVIIRDGRLTIAECKESGERLSELDVAKFISLGEELDAERVIFATATEFQPSISVASNSHSITVEWRDRATLLDRCGERISRVNGEGEARDPATYVEDLVERLSVLQDTQHV